MSLRLSRTSPRKNLSTAPTRFRRVAPTAKAANAWQLSNSALSATRKCRQAKSHFAWRNSLLRRQDHQAFHSQVDAEQPAAAGFGPQAAGDEELVHLRAAEGYVAGRHVAAVVAGDQLAVGVEYLHLLHAVV